MNNPKNAMSRRTVLLAGSIVLVALSGCLVDVSDSNRGYQRRSSGQMQAYVSYEDDYDYYPAYEVYYGRNRREYVYRDGSSWVRRSEPRGIELNALMASPSVRVDFRDSPEQHHSNVVRSYPRNWNRGPERRSDYQGRPSGQVQSYVSYEDDYDYYPAHEVYYSRNRREYVYREGSSWVRRPEPRGIELKVLLAAPSVRVDFRDSPERHHSTVVKSYPRNWKKDDRKDDQDDRRDERRRN